MSAIAGWSAGVLLAGFGLVGGPAAVVGAVAGAVIGSLVIAADS